MTEIIMQTYHVIDEIKNNNQIKRLNELKTIINDLYKIEVDSFNEAKTNYDFIIDQGGVYHKRYQEVAKNLSHAKSTLYQKQEVIEYMKIESNLQAELNDFLNQIAKTISKEIQTPNEFGIISKKGKHHVHK
jgi:cell fate (sporulation/competence/biofilm development) regulator YlbF (YheA/YmcA/DUF963 family)